MTGAERYGHNTVHTLLARFSGYQASRDVLADIYVRHSRARGFLLLHRSLCIVTGKVKRYSVYYSAVFLPRHPIRLILFPLQGMLLMILCGRISDYTSGWTPQGLILMSRIVQPRPMRRQDYPQCQYGPLDFGAGSFGDGTSTLEQACEALGLYSLPL